MTKDNTAPDRIYIRLAGDLMRKWAREPFDKGTEYIRLAPAALLDAGYAPVNEVEAGLALINRLKDQGVITVIPNHDDAINRARHEAEVEKLEEHIQDILDASGQWHQIKDGELCPMCDRSPNGWGVTILTVVAVLFWIGIFALMF